MGGQGDTQSRIHQQSGACNAKAEFVDTFQTCMDASQLPVRSKYGISWLHANGRT